MAYCIDCLYFDICQFNEKEQAVINLKSSYRDISNDIADDCRLFKNKADFVEVVRCKDCEYCVDLGMSGLYCDHDDNRNPLGCRPDDYCNDGERKSADNG